MSLSLEASVFVTWHCCFGIGKSIQEDPTIRGLEPLSRIWDHWLSILFMCGRWQPLENTGIRLWTQLCSRRVCCEEREEHPACKNWVTKLSEAWCIVQKWLNWRWTDLGGRDSWTLVPCVKWGPDCPVALLSMSQNYRWYFFAHCLRIKCIVCTQFHWDWLLLLSQNIVTLLINGYWVQWAAFTTTTTVITAVVQVSLH